MKDTHLTSPPHSASSHLRTIIWVAIFSLVLAYVAGMIHFGLVYLGHLSDSTAVRIESHVHEQISEIITEILLDQTEAVQERLRTMEKFLNRDPHIEALCIDLKISDQTATSPACIIDTQWNREHVIPIDSGSHRLGSLTVHYQLSGVFSKIFATIAPIFLFVIAIAMCVIFAIFRTAERIVIGPFAQAIRRTEQQDATHKAIRMLAHDVRKPFSMLAIMLGEIKQAHSMDEIALLSNRYHTAVHKSLHDITLQLNEFLFPADKAPAPICVSIAKLVKNSADAVHFIFKSHRRPEFCPTKDSLVNCNPHQLTRVFENILTNAYEACGMDGTIKISISEENDFVHVVIANSGPCIPEDDLSQIFSESYTKGKTHGHGLGLAIAKRFVEQNGGSIACENTTSGGVKFRMTFPKTQTSTQEATKLSQDQVLRTSPRSSGVEQRQAIRLLIVEDEIIYQDALLMCVERLNDKGARIIARLAYSSSEALHIAHEWQPHAIICDQNLGNESLSGMEIARTVHHKYSCIPILLLSNGILDTSTHLKNTKVTAVQKPMDMGTLELFLQTLRNQDPSSPLAMTSKRNSTAAH